MQECRKGMVRKMKKRVTSILAGVCAAAMLLTGCSSEISNEYVTISQYKELEVPMVEQVEVTDEMVEEEIHMILESAAEYIEVSGRAAQFGDMANINYVGRLNGEAFEGGTADGYDLELGSATFIDGFEEGIVGKEIGDVFDLELTFPEDYGSADLAGQKVVFEVTLNSITEVKVPELTDEWVQSYSETAKTVEEYKAEEKVKLQEYYEQSAKAQLEEAAWEKFMENTTVNKYNTEELQSLISLQQEQYKLAAEEYDMEFAEFIEAYTGLTEEEFNAEVSSVSKNQLKEKYAAQLVIEKEGIEITEEKKLPIYEQFVEYFGLGSVDELKTMLEEAGTLDTLEEQVEIQIVREWLTEHCKQVEVEESSEE